jgi:H+/Cl- antiporter ClcA
VRTLFGVVAGVATVVVVYLLLATLTLLVGGSDCDRGACNFVGEAASDDVGRWLLAAVYALVGVAAAVWLTARTWAYRRGSDRRSDSASGPA